MCHIETRRYTYADGSRSTVVEVPHPCKYASSTHYCDRVTTDSTPTEIHASSPAHLPLLRDDAPSPASLNPPTPPTEAPILIQERRPASIDRRPSTRGRTTRYFKPEITIEFGSNKKRGEKKYKRSSLGTLSIASSNEVNIDSPTSRASYSPIRTGFPEAPLPPPGSAGAYSTIPAYPTAHPTHHRHTSSSSSYSGSGYNPTLYAPSEPPASPTRRRSTRNPVSLHQPLPPLTQAAPPSPSFSTAPPSPFPYNTTLVTPRTSNSTSTSISAGSTFPLDYAQFVPASPKYPLHQPARPSNSGASFADRKLQEAADSALAASLQKKEEEEARQAALERGRFSDREKLRNEQKIAESEKSRAEERERARAVKRREQEARDAEMAAAIDREEREKARDREREKERERDTRNRSTRSSIKPSRLDDEIARRKRQQDNEPAKLSRRDSTSSKHQPPPSTTQTSTKHKRTSSSTIATKEYELALAETAAIMEAERQETARRERDERALLLRARQQRPEYWDPRGEMRQANVYNTAPGSPIMDPPSGMRSRRGSISSQPPAPLDSGFGVARRGSISSRRVSIHQPAPPTLSIDTRTEPQLHGPPPSRSAYSTQPPPPSSPGLTRRDSLRQRDGSSTRDSLRQRGHRVIAEAQEKAAAEERARERGKALRAAQGLGLGGRDDGEDADGGFGPQLGGRRRRGGGN